MACFRAVTAVLLLWRAKSTATTEIQLLQWNLHGECFQECDSHNQGHCDRNYPACKTHSEAFLNEMMAGEHAPGGIPDFAGVEQLGDRDYLESGLPHFGRAIHICGGEHGFGRYPFDVAVLFFNKEKWQPISRSEGGCMEHVWGSKVNNYRAYVMQTFAHKEHPDLKTVVVVAHYSHAVWGLPEMKHELQMMHLKTGVAQTILLADTNRECGTSSWNIMQALYPQAEEVATATLHRTCCVPHFQHCYDRIIAAQFEGAKGFLPTFLPLPEYVVQEWSAPNQHHPIKSKLIVRTHLPIEQATRLI